ncbi:dihydrodipicolinate reductase [Caminicella sporogenes DSM 14501]|uniref:4-hydroxy-tetrahydrodipicolinate reductase n=1 Tax=Caminicella sporogenes DSM 14501 TaxID=1121266 RepID=A0A1M6R638_9FIRM|nr:4-hydroxy-tetrahydrodipicolinate reductase [Caminicella sporogenes]RKD27316.1 4-hydroxy-tetrahydrodipicolinate reductase [Caminicella sporogenes]SHK27870.1 dihydrodipicolinate reductase [Caminicella sporogenes DSM 14501]
MLKVLLSGCNGKMGKVVTELIESENNIEIVAGIDISKKHNKFPVFKDFKDCTIKADVIIDFSHHSMMPALIDYSVKTKTPAVICTTGLDEEIIQKIKDASNKVALFKSGNMSLGVNLITKLAQEAAKVLSESFDIEIIEKHHNRKLDAPSGTAYMIADAINETLNNSKEYNFGRYGKSAKRNKNEIGIHAVRGGTIVGEHTVIYAGPDEIIEIKHTAMSRKIFAAGAIKAAKFLANKTSGLYNMSDILK